MILSQIKNTHSKFRLFLHLKQNKNRPFYDSIPNKKHTLKIQTFFAFEAKQKSTILWFYAKTDILSKSRQFIFTFSKAKMNHSMILSQIKNTHSKFRLFLHLKENKNWPFYDSMPKKTYCPKPDNSFSPLSKQKWTILWFYPK